MMTRFFVKRQMSMKSVKRKRVQVKILFDCAFADRGRLCCCLSVRVCLVVEETVAGESHGHVVLVSGLNDLGVLDGATGLGDELNTVAAEHIDVVAEGVEGVGAVGCGVLRKSIDTKLVDRSCCRNKTLKFTSSKNDAKQNIAIADTIMHL